MSDAVALRRARHAALLVEAAPSPPAPHDDEVLVDVDVALLGPDDRAGPPGRIVGREAVGVVRQVGAAVTGWHPGDRVALAAHVPCGRCAVCLAGRGTVCAGAAVPGHDRDGWACRHVTIPAHALFHVPGELDAAQAALVPGAVATAYHALKRAGIGQDVTAAVIGEDLIATHAVQLAALAGGTAIAVDGRADGREDALDLGAEEVVDPGASADLGTALREVTGALVDRVVLTPSGAGSVADAVALLRPGGRLVVVRPPGSRATVGADAVPVDALVAGDLDVVGTRVATPGDVRELFDLADDGRLVLATSIGARTSALEVPGALPADGVAAGRRLVATFT